MITYLLDIYPGLNNVSVPVIESQSLTALTGGTSIDEVRRIHEGVWQSYIPGRSFNEFEVLQGQYGYVVKASARETLAITGETSLSTILTLYSGINLIGVPIEALSIPVADFFIDRATSERFDTNAIFWYNPLRKRYISSISSRPDALNFLELRKGRGYFVFVDDEVEVEIEY